MAENNLSNKEQMIHDYMKELMKMEFPEADLNDNGAFMETFGLPHINMLLPLISFADRMSLKQSIENASLMTTEEMDEFGARYYIYRDPGKRATGYVTFIFSDIPISGVLNIPAGAEVLSKDGNVYLSSQTMQLTDSQLVVFYDPDSFQYRVPVQVDAQGTGEKYNVEVGDIMEVSTTLPNLEGVINEVPITGGVDAETNEEYAKKISDTAYAPNLGVNRGYIRFMQRFAEVEDVLVAGYGHPLMKRDIIGEFTNPGFFHQTVKDLHWGTKVDIYLRGKKLTEHVEFLDVKAEESGQLYVNLSKKPVHDILEVKLYLDLGQLDDPNIDESTLLINDYILRKEENFETEGTMNENVWLELNDERLTTSSNLKVTYRYNSLLEEINESMYDEDNRPPTADVLLKQANQKYVYGGMIVKMKSPLGLRERDKSWIRQQTYQWVNDLSMGDEVQFSDVTIPLTVETENLSDESYLVDYIKLPFQFAVFENANKYIFYCLNSNQRSVIEHFKTEKPLLYQIFEKYKGYIATYDFFDILHAFTFSSGLNKALNELDFISYEWGKRVNGFKVAKDMLTRSLMVNQLSPAVHSSGEHEYFELGDLYVYEDKEYTVDEWKNSISSIYELSLVDDEVNTYFEPLYLMVYCITIIYLLTAEEDLSLNRSKLYELLTYLTANTPIGYEFNM